DRLQLQVGGEALGSELAPKAARLYAAEWRGRVEHVVVYSDAARLHALGDIFAALVVVGPHAAAEPELGVVGDGHRLIDAVVGNNREHRPEDLLAGDRVAV